MKKLLLLLFSLVLFQVNAQKDVTQFLDIPVDGYKPEMIKKIKSRGFTIDKQAEDLLKGEFNGTQVYISIQTNNNKVWRIAVVDENTKDETNIKIRFNKLIRQFSKNNRYREEEDSTLVGYTIPKDEDVSYEMLVNNKRYEATFKQKSLKYDSLNEEIVKFEAKDTLNDDELKKYAKLLIEKAVEEFNSRYKQVWFMISEEAVDKYRIIIFYENLYNEADGSGL